MQNGLQVFQRYKKTRPLLIERSTRRTWFSIKTHHHYSSTQWTQQSDPVGDFFFKFLKEKKFLQKNKKIKINDVIISCSFLFYDDDDDDHDDDVEQAAATATTPQPSPS